MRNILITLIFSFIIISCSEPSATENLTSAQNAIYSKDYVNASIYLKKVIQEQPKNIKARLLLAQVYQTQGIFISAEKEWTKADELGAPVSETILNKLISLYVLDDNVAINEYWQKNQTTLESSVILNTVHIPVLSLFKLNKIEEAKQLLTSAENIAKEIQAPKKIVFLKKLNIILFEEQSKTKKSELISNLSKKYNFDLPLNLLLANIQNLAQNYQASSELYEDIAIRYPEFAEAMIVAVETFLRQPNLTKAQLYVDKLLYDYPKHPYINQLAAQIKIQQKEFFTAKKHVEEALLTGQPNPQLRILAGLTYFQLKNYELAESYLDGLEIFFPKNDFVKKLIVSNKLKLGTHSKITDIISSKDDIELLSATSIALLKTDPSVSFKLLEKLELNDIENIADRNRLGIAKLMSRNALAATDVIQSARETLNNAESSTEAITSSRFLLVSALIKEGNLDEAEEYLHQWLKAEPKNTTLLLFLANINIQRKPEESINTYKKVLTLDPDNRVALLKLGQHSAKKMQFSQANQYFENIIKNNKYDAQALIGLYNSDSQLSLADAALKKAEEKLLPLEQETANEQLMILTNIYLIANEPSKAIELIGKHKEKIADNSKLAFELITAEAHLQQTEFGKSVAIYDEILRKQMHLKILRKKLAVHNAAKTQVQAIDDLQQLLKKHTDNVNLAILSANYFVDHKESKLAIELLNKTSIPKEYINISQAINAKALYFEGEYQKALPLLEKQYDIVKSNQLASFTFNALLKMNKEDAATSFMKAHINNKPNDNVNRLQFANQQIGKDSDEAIKQYRKIIETTPNNVIVLNNLAWLLFEKEQFSDAKIYVDQALALAPNNKDVLDTRNQINKAMQ